MATFIFHTTDDELENIERSWVENCVNVNFIKSLSHGIRKNRRVLGN